MNIKRQDLSNVNFAEQMGWKISGTRQELEALKATIQKLLDSRRFYCFKCNMGSDVFEVVETTLKPPESQWIPPVLEVSK